MAGRAGQKKSIKRLEQDFQKSLIATLRLVLWPHKTMVFHVPNGGYRSRVEAAILSGMGVVSGIPDLVVFFVDASGLGRVVCIECKAPGKTTSDDQDVIHEKLTAIGVPVITVEDTRTAIEFLRNHGVPLRMAECTGD